MYLCLTLKIKKVQKVGAKATLDRLSPIMVHIGPSTTFYMDNEGATRVKILDVEWELVETLQEIAELISNNGNGMLVVNKEWMIKKYFTPEEEQ